ncbi:hypothetical protein PPYR_08598 [Photinus pyralis]|uniref:Uncharacterized protein n=1 Tax=Photinus pyralis TaxID=7054 RepID=A0A5N4AJS1_PHOPY|nr:uncharacterized protein LOC116170605 [Photinus pyralis]KAB0797605.1 hypothetical protein PPYR_08598 [Photinus pyralis]
MVNILDCNSSENTVFMKRIPIQKPKSEIKIRLEGIKHMVQNLELSVTESDFEDKQLLRQLQVDGIKNFSMLTQLNEARKENKQLLNLLHQKYEQNSSRSHTDFSTTYSTMSVVNLQYKYEELLNNHDNLLRLLSSKDKEVKRLCKENEDIIQNTSDLSKKLQLYESLLEKLCTKYVALKEKKNVKITKLKTERETLMLAHNQLLNILNSRYMDSDDLLRRYLRQTDVPQRALLLQEVQRVNALEHANLLLKQDIVLLKASMPNLCSRCSSIIQK